MTATAWEAWQESDDFAEMAVEWLLTEADADDLPDELRLRLLQRAVSVRLDEMVEAAIGALRPHDLDKHVRSQVCDLFEGTRSADLCFDHWLDLQADRGQS